MPRKPAAPAVRLQGARLAASIRSTREDRELSAESMARAADLSVDTVRRIERGVVPNPGFFTVVAMARVLDLDLDGLAADAISASGSEPGAADAWSVPGV